MTVKTQRDLWSGLLFMAIGSSFALGALNYRFGDAVRPGPGYFPFGLGLILTGLGALIAARSLVICVADREPIAPAAWRAPVVIIVSVVVAGITLPWLGALIALPLLVLISAMASHEFRLREVMVLAVVLTFGCWVIFSKILGLPIDLFPTFSR